MQPFPSGTSFQGQGEHFCYFSSPPLTFEPESENNAVFYDPFNKQVFAVRACGALGVTMKGPNVKDVRHFRLENRGPLTSISFSPDNEVLAVQRSRSSIEFVNFLPHAESTEYSQSCKNKNAEILGFAWTGMREIVFVTHLGVEFYSVLTEKRTLRLLKSESLQIKCFKWSRTSDLLMISAGSNGTTFHPILVKNGGTIIRLPKFDVDLPCTATRHMVSPQLEPRDWALCDLYGEMYLLLLTAPFLGASMSSSSSTTSSPSPSPIRGRPSANTTSGTEIVLFKITRESPSRRAHILQVEVRGELSVNVVSQCVLVHHRPSRATFLYDIALDGTFDGSVHIHQPIVGPLPIAPASLPADNLQASVLAQKKGTLSVPQYAPSWVVFQPDIIIDSELGLIFTLELDPRPLEKMMNSNEDVISFLVNHIGCEEILSQRLLFMLRPKFHAPLYEFIPVFKRLIRVELEHALSTIHPQQGSLMTIHLNQLGNILIPSVGGGPSGHITVVETKTRYQRPFLFTQNEIYSKVFTRLTTFPTEESKFHVSVLLEYLRGLHEVGLPVHSFMFELLVKLYVRHRAFYQLHQAIQYHVLLDSVPVACQLFALESEYPPAFQLALDMLKRLKAAEEEIVEVLLSKHLVFESMKFLRSQGHLETAPAFKFLEAAQRSEDSLLFYETFKVLERRNLQMRGNPKFLPEERCETFVQHFLTTFGREALESS